MDINERLTNQYLNTAESFSPDRKSGLARVDSGNFSVPQSPMRYENSGHAMRNVDGILGAVGNMDDESNSVRDEIEDDEIDEEEDVVNLRLPIIDSYGDKGDYEGGVLRNSIQDGPIPSSLGTMRYADGRVYSGRWKDGQWDGHGKTHYPNGDSYEGDYETDQRHGIGIYKWRDGRIFQGNFRNDQRNGHGVYKWPDGSTYVGGFLEGQRHGEGTYSFQDGSVYTGEWRRGIRHGIGEYHWVDGRIYKGQWVNGKAHGYGTENRPDGSIRHDGQWEFDRPI